MKKPKVVLLTAPQRLEQDRSSYEMGPNIGIISLIKWAEKSGYHVDLYDIDSNLPSDDEISEYFRSKKPDLAGISAVVSTSYAQVKGIASLIKKASPDTTIVVGSNMAVAANTILRKTKVDLCALGDGEKTFTALIDHISKNSGMNTKKVSEIKGLAFINSNGEMEFTGYGEPIPGDQIPFPDYDLFCPNKSTRDADLYRYIRPVEKSDLKIWFEKDPRYNEAKNRNTAEVYVAKGCIAKCTFCQRFCAKYQILDLGMLDKHLSELKEKYSVGFISLGGENFIVDKKFSYEVVRLLNKYGMLWMCGAARCDSINMDDLIYFKKNGCVGMKLGIESGSPRILKIMQKRFSKEDVLNALRDLGKLDLWAPLLFCIAMPGETDETVKETGKFLGEIASEIGVPPSSSRLNAGFSYAMLSPGAPLYEYGLLQGIMERGIDAEEEFLNYISDARFDKSKFVNLTGRSMREVLFWEYMVFYEATRFYYTNKGISARDRSPKLKTGSSRKISDFFTIRTLKTVIKSTLFTPISSLNSFLCRSTKISVYMPRSILYPVMRNLLFIEYLIKQSFAHLFGRKGAAILKYQFTKLKYDVSFEDGKSLRKINEELREKENPPVSLTDKNQQTLYLGR